MDLDTYLENKHIEDEALCKHCGACCGILDKDPCQHLKTKDGNLTYCDIYNERFGLRQTVSGKYFLCVPIRSILHKSWSGSYQCAYKKRLLK